MIASRLVPSKFISFTEIFHKALRYIQPMSTNAGDLRVDFKFGSCIVKITSYTLISYASWLTEEYLFRHTDLMSALINSNVQLPSHMPLIRLNVSDVRWASRMDHNSFSSCFLLNSFAGGS